MPSRIAPSTTRLEKYTVSYYNQEEFHLLKREIFSQEQYFFTTNSPQPIILDLGANIGLSSLYFHKLYPTALMMAVEPVPTNYELLTENIWQNHLEEQIFPYQIATAPHSGELQLHTDVDNNWHSTAGVIVGNWTQTQTTQSLTVTAQTLDNLWLDFQQNLKIKNHIDLLKIDIEGLEQAVLTTAAKTLNLTDQLICEFHPHPQQNLRKLVAFLEKLPPNASGQSFKVELIKNQKTLKLEQVPQGLIMIHAYRS